MRSLLRYAVPVAAVGLAVGTAAPPALARPAPPHVPTAVWYGGAVASVDPDATQAGLDVLRHGGTAADAAVAVASTLGVTEPYVAGVGGGGFFVYYDARTHRVSTLDGREKAPAAFTPTVFTDGNGNALDFFTVVTSGLSVGVPGNLLTWQEALNRWGTLSLRDALRPAERVADRGFVVDQTFHDQTASNAARLGKFAASSKLFLPGGQPPAVGSVFRNPDLASTYRQIGAQGVGALYRGSIGSDLVRVAQNPDVTPGNTVFHGLMTRADLAAYTAPGRAPTHVNYRGLDLYGMAPPSSGGSTVGEALNILSHFPMSGDRVQALHDYLEASKLAYADRNRWVGDPDQVDVPLAGLLSPAYGASRACLVDQAHAATAPVPPGDPTKPPTGCATAGAGADEPHEGASTNHFVVADRWGNVVSYTNTIEQIAGSAITVPGRGFLLNNELTDFDFVPLQAGVPDPNLPAASKRPRSSMSPTIVLRHGEPWLAVGSPGGATIITTTLQILLNRIDFGMSLPDAIAAPRISQRNRSVTDAEAAFLAGPYAGALQAKGQVFTLVPDIGAATGLEFLGHGKLLAAAEPVRRGVGAAGVVVPAR
jgi:gamma-glutamyltranspeptidase / glutathione hydrolase